MEQETTVAVTNLLADRYIFTLLTAVATFFISLILIGIKKGWWSIKRKDYELSGKVKAEVRQTVEKEIDIKQKERDKKWNNILTYQRKAIQEFDEEKAEIKHSCLIKQLCFVDDSFDSEEVNFELQLAGDEDRTSELVQLAVFKFENTYHKTKREIVQVIKDNNLLNSTEEELIQKIRKRANKNTDFFRKDSVFYPVKIDEKMIDDYEKFVEKVSEEAIVMARKLAEKREEDIKKLSDRYEKAISAFIETELQ